MKAWTQKGPSQAGNGAGRGKLSRVDRRYTSALSYSAHIGPNTSCLHPSSITRGGSFFGQGPPGPLPFKGQRPGQGQCDTQRPADQATTSITSISGFRPSSSAVATSREGHRQQRSDLEVRHQPMEAARTATAPARLMRAKQPNAKIFVNFALLSSPRC